MHYDKELISHKLCRWEQFLKGYRLPDWDDIPDFGLYMDQVMVLLANYLDFVPTSMASTTNNISSGLMFSLTSLSSFISCSSI